MGNDFEEDINVYLMTCSKSEVFFLAFEDHLLNTSLPLPV